MDDKPAPVTGKAASPGTPGLGILAPASVYVAIRLLSQSIVFGVSLLLAGLLPIEAFAAIGSAFLIQTMLTPLSGLALHSGLERLFFTYDDALRRRKILTIYLASFLANVGVSALAYILLTTVLRLEFLSDKEVGITIVSSLLMSVQYVPIVTMRCEGKLSVFALMQMAFVVVTQAAILIAVLVRRDVEAFFYGTLIGSAAGFVMWCVWLLLRTGLSRPVSIAGEVRYSMPGIPIGALEAVQQAMDRYVLQLAIPGAQFATYALALRFAGPVSTMAQGAKSALYPILYRVGDEKQISKILSDTTNLSIGFFGVLVNVIVAAMAVVVTYLLSPEYQQVLPVFIVIVVGVFLRVQEVFLGVGADVTMSQHKKLFTLAPVMILQIAISVVLILLFGLWGAVAAFVINGAVRSLAMALLGQRLLPRQVMLAEYFVFFAATIAPLAICFCTTLFLKRGLGPEFLLTVFPMLVLFLIARRRMGALRRPAA